MAIGIVLGGSLKCRREANTSSGYYGSFSTGTRLTLTEIPGNSEWWKTTWTSGSVGYVMRAYVAVAGDTVRVTGSSVNVRSGAGSSYSSLYQLSTPTTATVVSVATNWVQINPANHSAGWMSATYLVKVAGNSFPWSVSTTTTGVYSNAKVLNGSHCVYEEPPTSGGIHVESLVTNSRHTVANYNFYFFKFNASDGSVKFLLRTNVDNSYCAMAPNTIFGSGTLQSGSSGPEVTALQHYLNRYLAYRSYTQFSVDGSFGPTTKAKLESFQTYMNSEHNAGLAVDGIAGTQTKKWLACFVQNECN